jgi:hypothetical protein
MIDGNGLGEIGDRGRRPCRQAARISARRGRAMMFLLIVQKMRQALTFLATIENHDPGMKTLAVISILALLTISGAAYTDRILTSDRQAAQEAN